MMPDNNWYGHRSILARFCNVKDQPVFGSLQHGWFSAHPKILFSNQKLDFLNTFVGIQNSKKKQIVLDLKISIPLVHLFYICVS